MERSDIACLKGSPQGGTGVTAKWSGLHDRSNNAGGWAFGRFSSHHERSELELPPLKIKIDLRKDF